jgi:hypothetical protein
MFLSKASALIQNPNMSSSELHRIHSCGYIPINAKITSHLLNAKEQRRRDKKSFTLGKLFDFFRITWNVKMEAVPEKELNIGCRNYALPHRIVWKYPIFTEIKDPENKYLWKLSGWDTQEFYFDLYELEQRLGSDAKFNHEARITVSTDKVTLDLGYKYQ